MAKNTTKQKDNSKFILLFAALFALIGVVSLTASYAEKGGKSKSNTSNSTYSWVVSPDPVQFKDTVTATVTSSQLPAARITQITCTKDGKTVLSSAQVHKLEEAATGNGEYVFTQKTALLTPSWTSGGAECKAELGSLDSRMNFRAISSTAFTVNP